MIHLVRNGQIIDGIKVKIPVHLNFIEELALQVLSTVPFAIIKATACVFIVLLIILPSTTPTENQYSFSLLYHLLLWLLLKLLDDSSLLLWHEPPEPVLGTDNWPNGSLKLWGHGSPPALPPRPNTTLNPPTKLFILSRIAELIPGVAHQDHAPLGNHLYILWGVIVVSLWPLGGPAILDWLVPSVNGASNHLRVSSPVFSPIGTRDNSLATRTYLRKSLAHVNLTLTYLKLWFIIFNRVL